nr:MAG TPA: hypothetical protein [Caudoviricetes sp.]
MWATAIFYSFCFKLSKKLRVNFGGKLDKKRPV